LSERSCAAPAYAKTEGQTCTYCQVTAGKPELNAGGQYYAYAGLQ
jgi:hypothetical protein